MGDVAITASRLLPKISALYNSSNFSDVQFFYDEDTGDSNKIIFGHKLILAIRSKLFSQMFYKKSVFKVKIPINQKEWFEKLLKYLYTDNINFYTLEEAYDMLNLAQVYGVQDLIDRCNEFILDDKLTLSNLFPKYEYALKRNLGVLLDQCRAFVCSQTVLILLSEEFLKASSEIIEDIIKLENLSISSELEIITAVLDWVKEDMKNKNIPVDKKLLRKATSPFMKNLRFLALSQADFDYFVDNYDIFTGREISVLTRKMLQPLSNDSLPDDICPIILNRKKNALKQCSSPDFKESVTNTENKAFDGYSAVLVFEESALDPKNKVFGRNSSVSDFEESASSIENKALDRYSAVSVLEKYVSNTRNKALSRNSPVSDSEESASNTENKALDRYSAISVFEKPVSNTRNKALSRNSSVSDSEESAPNQLHSKIKMHSFPNKNETKMNSSDRINKISSLKSNQIKFNSSTDIRNEVLHHSFTRGTLRSYSFPLNEFSDTTSSLYPSELSSCVSFEMISGKLLLYGFELKIRNRSRAPEQLDVFMYLEGFSKQPLKETFQRELCNNALTVQFPKPMTLHTGSKGNLEVSVDSIHFNRFYTCDNKKSVCELKSGLNFSVKLSLVSQKKFPGGFYFTIDKLLYKI